MDVRDCKQEYKNFGRRIFSRKRYYRWTRYSSAKLEDILKQVVQSRCADVGSVKDGKDKMYQDDPVRSPCRTYVML
jgi:hypothetical protein